MRARALEWLLVAAIVGSGTIYIACDLTRSQQVQSAPAADPTAVVHWIVIVGEHGEFPKRYECDWIELPGNGVSGGRNYWTLHTIDGRTLFVTGDVIACEPQP